jgi:hypothetical protein
MFGWTVQSLLGSTASNLAVRGPQGSGLGIGADTNAGPVTTKARVYRQYEETIFLKIVGGQCIILLSSPHRVGYTIYKIVAWRLSSTCNGMRRMRATKRRAVTRLAVYDKGSKQSAGVSDNQVVHAIPRQIDMMCRIGYADARRHAIGDRV